MAEKKANPAVRYFLLIGMFLGFMIIVISQLEDVSSLESIESIRSLIGFEILSVDQDPITGEIRGNVVLGRPDTRGIAWTGSAGSSSTCNLGTQGGLVNWVVSFGSGTSSGGCTYGTAEWDLSELPDDLTITSMIFKLKTQKFFPFLTEPSSRDCKIGIIEQPLSTIADSNLVNKFFNPDFILRDGNWCSTSGEKSFIVDQTTIDAFERALRGDDKMTLSFTMSTLAKGTGCCMELSDTFWATEGSWVINGFAEPIQCAVGEHQVGFKCELLVCDEGFEVNGNICSMIQCPIGENLIGSICTPVQCQVGERLVGNLCETIICPVGTTLIGSDCEPIICQDGFTLSGNECTVIVCPTGNELIGSTCQMIGCPVGTTLQGNDCNAIICPTGTFLDTNNCLPILCQTGEVLVGDICKPLECQIGETLVGSTCQQIICDTGSELIGSECTPINCLSTEELVGNTCEPKPLECPLGTSEQQNVCVQVLPQLQATSAPVNLLTITGIGIFLISFGGLVVRAIVRRQF
jgi:hypothetical protein